MNKLLKSFTLIATFLSSVSIGILPFKASARESEVITSDISSELEAKGDRDEFPGRRQGGGSRG